MKLMHPPPKNDSEDGKSTFLRNICSLFWITWRHILEGNSAFVVTNVRNPNLVNLETLAQNTWFNDMPLLRTAVKSAGSYKTIHKVSHPIRLRMFILKKFLCARKL